MLGTGLGTNMSLLSIESEGTRRWYLLPEATREFSETAVAFGWIIANGFGHFQWLLWKLMVFS